jgi:tetratricopeptide (TPR) repeat protein
MQDRNAQASDYYQLLLDRARQSGDRNWQLEGWHGLGRLHRAAGRAEAAVDHHERALALAIELDQPDDQARAHDGLAHAHRALGQTERARTHWQHALDILIDLGIEETEDENATVSGIRANLADLESGPE